MALTAAERAKKYRDRIKQNKTKYIDFQRKDCERKARKQALMNAREKEKYRDKHRISQREYHKRLKGKDNNTTQSNSSYNKQTLAKAVNKAVRVLPNDQDRRCQVIKRIGQDSGLFQKPVFERTQIQISQTVIKQVQDFYANDSISWQAPGKRDFITIRENGSRVRYQKRHLLHNIREVHELFVQEHSGVSISPSAFAKLRPKHILSKNTLAHRICVCVIHENVNLLLEVLSKEVHGLKNNLNDFLSKLVCDENEECRMMSCCDICKNNFDQYIVKKMIDKKKVISWNQWVNVNGHAIKKNFSSSVSKCVRQLKLKTPKYLYHVYIKRKQSSYFEYIKDNADDQTVACQIDYAENFALDNQDQIQSAYWSKKYISIFTAYIWMGGSSGDGQSFGLVSDSIKHDEYAVITCLEIIVNEIISIMPDVNQIIFFSDNAASQFKNQYIINHLTTMLDVLDIDFSWNYFASSHGKGVVDGVGGTLKRLVWLEIMGGKRCSSAADFVKICQEKTKTISTILIRQAQFDRTKSMFENIFSNIIALPGIQNQHYIQALHKNIIQHARYTTSENQYVFRF